MVSLLTSFTVCLVITSIGSAVGLIASSSSLSSSTRLLGYYNARAQKDLSVEAIPHSDLTHVVLINAIRVDNEGNLIFRPKRHDWEHSAEELIARLTAPNVTTRLIVSIRGHPDDVALDEVSENETVREKVVTAITTQIRKWGADGVEIEWHADDAAGGKALSAPFDTQEQNHFAILCRDLYDTLRASGHKTLSVAVRPGRQEFSDGHFVRSHVDWLMLRAYSMRSLGDPHHSSLKDMHKALNEWMSKGVPVKKLVLGTPLFGKPGAPLHMAGDRNEALHHSWFELSSKRTLSPDSSAKDMQGDIWKDARSGKTWWFSGLNTTCSKAVHVVQSGLGGLAFHDLNHDSKMQELSLVHAAVAAAKSFFGRQRVNHPRRTLLAHSDISFFQRGMQLSVVLSGKDEF